MEKRNLPDRYTDLRVERNLSQTNLAKALKCNKQYISKLESGERTMSLALLEKYADFFNVSIDYLLGRTDVKSNDTTLQGACEYTGLNEEAVKKISALASNVGGEILNYSYYIPDNGVKETLNYVINNSFFEDLIKGVCKLQVMTETAQSRIELYIPSLKEMIDTAEDGEHEFSKMRLEVTQSNKQFTDIKKDMLVIRYDISRKFEKLLADICDDTCLDKAEKDLLKITSDFHALLREYDEYDEEDDEADL